MPVPKQTTPPDFIPADPDFIPAAAPATQPLAAPPPDNRNFIQKSFDENTKTSPSEPLLQTGLKSVVSAIGSPFVHPLDTAKSMANSIEPDSGLAGMAETALGPAGPLLKHMIGGTAKQVGDDYKEGGAPYAATKLAGGTFGGMALGSAMGAAAPAAQGARTMAIGDTDAAALRGLRVPAGGKKVLPMQNSVQIARPYLQGAKSLQDLQERIPAAKNEAFAPYKETIDAVGDVPVKGPDGMTTIRALEDERQELSAMNRGLRTGDPSALRLAEQKGMSQAESLAREKAIQAHLDPALSRYGIDPQGIRKAYGSVARIGNQVEGRSTLLEKPQPSGFGKIVRPVSLIDTMEPTGIPGKQLVGPIHQIGGGIRDIVAGRPLWSAKPTDLGIREGFANAGPKPDFGRYTPFQPQGLLGRGAIPMGSGPDMSGPVEGYRAPNFYRDTDAMRTGRLLSAPPIELGGHVEGTAPPPFHYDTTPMRKGLLLPEPSLDTPLSSHPEIFPEQRPGSALLRKRQSQIINGKVKK